MKVVSEGDFSQNILYTILVVIYFKMCLSRLGVKENPDSSGF
jgi:hypothetical protein